MRAGPYEQWAESLHTSHRAIYETAITVPFLTISQRKVILTQARCQVLPVRTTIVYFRHAKLYQSQIDYHGSKPPLSSFITLYHFAMSLEYFMNPIFSGLLSLLLRCAPHVHEGPIWDEIESGKMKEITAAITPFDGPSFDYTSIFSRHEEDRDMPMTPLFNELPTRKYTSKMAYNAFVRTKVCYRDGMRSKLIMV